MAGYISPQDLKKLKKEYKPGKWVTAVQVKGIEPEKKGVVKSVKFNGDIIVLWNDGHETVAVYGEDRVALVINGKCLLGNDMSYGGCDSSYCRECGWNSDIAEERKQRLLDGDVTITKNGVRKLIVKRKNFR